MVQESLKLTAVPLSGPNKITQVKLKMEAQILLYTIQFHRETRRPWKNKEKPAGADRQKRERRKSTYPV